MKYTLARTSLALLLSLSLLPSAYALNNSKSWDYLAPDRTQRIASLNITELLKRHHYSKDVGNQDRSSKMYEGYLKMLDPARMYFTQEDLSEFKPWKKNFANKLREGDLEPGYFMYKRQLTRLDQYLTFALAKLAKGVDSIDFTLDESLETDREKAPWAKNEAELQELWRKRLKDEVLRLKLASKEPKAIEELLTKRYKNQQKRLQQTRSEDVFQTYVNSFSQTYDPHTNYLSPDNAENFDINMSLSLEGIGAVLQGDNEHVKIVRLVPSGPADKSKQLAPADKIIGVAQGNKEMVDVIGWRLDEVVKLIRGKKGSTVRLEVIPASNAPNDLSSKTVTIVRESVKLEEQAAQKSILNLEHEGKPFKLGIIEIPAFYIDFKAYRAGDPNYKSTTRDVRKLLAELQQEQVDGLVIDLRNNGGGSLQEATELSSLFIPQGPSVLVRNNDGRVDVLEDDNKGVFYQGPMAVLVNRLSASASEIFAGAIQDYHRGLIIGGQTFGKGTVQTIQPLNHGELKFTIAKFYRVSGQSTQHQGVLPDISYPAEYNTKEIGESALPEAMPWDSIKPAINLGPDPFKPYLKTLEKRHAQRTKHNPDFVFSHERLALSKALMKDTVVSLNEEKRRAEQDKIDQQQLAMENKRRLAKGEKAMQLKELKKEDEDLAAELEKEKENKQKPEKDAFLVETGHILLDWLSLHQQQVAKHSAK
ncbi:carboxy terminal-processing peptidase [Thiopseudomonas alkaliphila]|uniref:carboxy terminal-processing peptidase n=1 Tax=Thiopseudomonas alkaliphila TaxID=1697053 RepID=UPI00069D6941|nr:carboxy terminal-processing peptidase [Thiopseudomonas alkaliphila]AKX51538.1 peptidase S41 [Thiopseudomonas alkaliphila]AKX55788.1 peptidase S41 [Thiopseudomonas alkaliphila]AKX57882.1 peptidase S41 [Thiopseudomonas alkaliphila]